MKKIKGSVKAIFPDAALLVFCFGILAACPIRVYQILKLIEPSTGFYSDTSNWSIITLYIILIACSVIILLFSYLSKNIPAARLPEGRRIPLAISGLIFSATFISDIFNQIDEIKTLAANNAATGIANFAAYIKAAGATLPLIEIIFAALSCIYMLVFSVSFIVGRDLYAKLKVLALSPLVWAMIRVFFRVTKKISFIQVSDLILELFALVFIMIFFFTFARVASGVNSTDSMWSMYACGITASLLILTYSLPRLMLFVTGNSALINPEAPLELCDIGIAIFAITIIVSTLRSGYPVTGEPERKITLITAEAEADFASSKPEAAEQTETAEDTVKESYNESAPLSSDETEKTE